MCDAEAVSIRVMRSPLWEHEGTRPGLTVSLVPGAQDLRRLGVQRNTARVPALGRFSEDGENLGVEVDGTPPQSEPLTAAKSGIQRQEDQRAQMIEVVTLSFGHRRAPSSDAWRTLPPCPVPAPVRRSREPRKASPGPSSNLAMASGFFL